jgi:transposase-like protein
MVLDHERDHPSRWAAVVSIAEKIGCALQTLHDWLKKTELDSGNGNYTRVANQQVPIPLIPSPSLQPFEP